MTMKEPVVLEDSDLDLFESILETLADGGGLANPTEDFQDECEERLERVREARP